jgi:hypothetical protein
VTRDIMSHAITHLNARNEREPDSGTDEWPAVAGHSITKNQRGRLTPFRFGET